MVFFGKILNLLGFYSDDDLKKLDEKKQEKSQQKIKKKTERKPAVKTVYNQPQIKLFTPYTQEEVGQIVDILKTGESVKVDLKNFTDDDLLRAIDFLQGACYTLDIQPIFETGTTILLQH